MLTRVLTICPMPLRKIYSALLLLIIISVVGCSTNQPTQEKELVQNNNVSNATETSTDVKPDNGSIDNDVMDYIDNSNCRHLSVEEARCSKLVRQAFTYALLCQRQNKFKKTNAILPYVNNACDKSNKAVEVIGLIYSCSDGIDAIENVLVKHVMTILEISGTTKYATGQYGVGPKDIKYFITANTRIPADCTR